MATTPGAFIGQNVSAQVVSRSFKRIRLVSRDDFLACYSVVASFINRPEAASSVEECIIDPPRESHYPYTALNRPPVETLAVDFDDGLHRLMKEYVATLGLGEEITGEMLEALDIRKRELLNPPTETPCFDFGHYLGSSNPKYDLTIATLLISLCPNITILRVYEIYSHTLLGQFLLKNNYGKLPKPALQKLKEVQLHPVNCMDERIYDYIRTLDDIRYFHRLPAINSLSLEGVEDSQAEDGLFPARSSPCIKKIHIGHSDISGEMIGIIIRIPRALEEFSLSTYGLQSPDGGNSLRYPKTLGKCLLEHRESLRELDLDAAVSRPHGGKDEHGRDQDERATYEGGEEERYAHEINTWYFIQDMNDSDSAAPLWSEDLADTREYTALSIGSLHDFKALKRLSIRIGLLLGYDDVRSYGTPIPSVRYRLVDALPPNLEYLRLYGYKKGQYPDIDAHVTELLEQKAERFPGLGEIEGVDEFLPGVPGRYGPLPDEEDIWERPCDNLDWVVAR
ncbi:hypothetical protein BR93DRAFT_968196 [Coniochaeta sp. PMI_546]|nr:hypothetical protein BR93DRAFT_968196 [Coniochaeta sp. PMI_546]